MELLHIIFDWASDVATSTAVRTFVALLAIPGALWGIYLFILWIRGEGQPSQIKLIVQEVSALSDRFDVFTTIKEEVADVGTRIAQVGAQVASLHETIIKPTGQLREIILATGIEPAVIDRLMSLHNRAASNDPTAMIELANLHECGDLLKADLKEAARLYQRAGAVYAVAADKGDAAALTNLGLMRHLDLFSTMPPDPGGAEGLFKKAAAKGDPDAKAMLAYLNDPPDTREEQVELLTSVYVLLSRYRPYFVMKYLHKGLNKDWYEESMESEVRVNGRDRFSSELKRAIAAFWKFRDDQEKWAESGGEGQFPERPNILKYVNGAFRDKTYVERWLPHYDDY